MEIKNTDITEIEREANEYDDIFADDLIPSNVKDGWSEEFIEDLNNLKNEDLNDVFAVMDNVIKDMNIENKVEVEIEDYIIPEDTKEIESSESMDKIKNMYEAIWNNENTSQEEKESQIKGIEILKRTIENSEDSETLGKCKYIFDNKINKDSNIGYNNFEEFYNDIKNIQVEHNIENEKNTGPEL